MVQDSIKREVETLLDSYGTEYWDDRDVTYDNLVWGTSGIEIPIKRILFQVELIMQDAVSNFMPQVADVMAQELQRTIEIHEIASRLERASYDQPYTYTIPGETTEALPLLQAFDTLIKRVGANFRHVCRQATMYELMRPERSVHHRLEAGERELALSTNDRLLDVALHGVDAVRQDIATTAPAPSANSQPATPAQPAVQEDEIAIRILDEPAAPADPDIDISFLSEKTPDTVAPADLETSYADRLDDISVKVNRIFGEIINDLFSDDELLPRLRRLFWLEATKAERDFNNQIIKPMIKNHDRNLHRPELREAMEVDLESISDLEELMRVWDGLHNLEKSLPV